MNQDEFNFGDFEAPAARWSDPETSHEAAHDASFRASHGRTLAMEALLKQGPLTDFELASITGWQQTSIGKRRGECARAGLVEVLLINGEVQKRPAPSGSSARVWQLTEKGRKYLQRL